MQKSLAVLICLAGTVAAAQPPAIVPPVAVLMPAPRRTARAISTYSEGSLTIVAHDAPLGEILKSIADSTGAVIEAPALDELVSVRLGPQAPVLAIASLLDGMLLNYVILGGTSQQDHLQRIVITMKPGPASSPAPAVSAAAVEAQARAAMRFVEETGGDEGVWDNEPPPQTTSQ